jgi:hypothetical protein
LPTNNNIEKRPECLLLAQSGHLLVVQLVVNPSRYVARRDQLNVLPFSVIFAGAAL